MKKIFIRSFSLMMAVVLAFTGLPLISQQTEAATTTFVAAGTAKTDLNVRQKAKVSSTSLASLSKGTIYTITDVYNDTWFKVKTISGVEGYVKISLTNPKINAKVSTNCELYADKAASLSFGTLASGTQVTALTPVNGYSYIITSSGLSGYVKSSALTSVTAAKNRYMLTSAAYLRAGAGTNYKSKGKVPAYVVVYVTSTVNPIWYKVKLANGVTGYILSSKLKKVANTTKLTPISKSMYITTSDVNLRSGAGTSYTVKAYINENVIVTVTGTSNSGWYQVKTTDGTTGYISSTYLKKLKCTVATGTATATPKATATASPTATAKATATPAASATYMTNGKMNVRKSASKSSDIVATVPKYFVVTVTDKSNSSWYKIKIGDGTVGYILASSLTVTTNKATKVKYPLYTTTANVNLRSGAGITYSVKKVVKTNTLLSVTNSSNSSWYKVMLNDGTTGYIYSENLTSTPYTKKTSTATATPAATATTKPTATPSATDAPAPTAAPTNTYYKVNVSDGLNVRSAASTSSSIVEILSYGDVVTLVEMTSTEWYKIKTKAGNTGYVYASYLVDYNTSGTEDVTLSGTLSIPQYKTYYLGTSGTSANTSIATIKNGYVYGVKPGTTTIGSIKVIVTAPEAVRFAYSTPNNPSAGEAFKLVAVTDTGKSAVKFKLVSSSGSTTYTSSSYTTESTSASNGYAGDSVRVWKSANITLPAGDYTLTVTSKTNGTWSTSSFITTVHVSSFAGSYTSNDDHYASDKILTQITNYEGYVPTVTADSLANGTPTVAYGIVVYKGNYFYNNVTKTEAYAMMINLINNGTFTKSLNDYVDENNLKLNQAQWDALLSFSYNVGTAWMSSSTLSTILKNTVYGDLKASSSSPKAATTVFKTYMYKTASKSADKVFTSQLSSGTSVSIIGKTATTLANGYKDMWYKVTYNGKTGYIRAGALKLAANSSYPHDLAYVDPQAFSQNLLDWHKAGGNCIEGLFYRRLSEAKTFLYGNYDESIGTSNYTKNTYNFTYSDSTLGISWNP